MIDILDPDFSHAKKAAGIIRASTTDMYSLGAGILS